MIGGVSFQPGSQEQDSQQAGARRASGSNQGVQEAIKVLSLRLPKVVGAQAVAPSALLHSQGSGGNSRVDSIVQSVMSKFFPQQGQMAAPMQPQAERGMPSGIEGLREAYQGQPSMGSDREVNRGQWSPRVIVGNPIEAPLTGTAPRWPNQPGVDGGGGFPAAMIDQLPDLRRQLDWLPPPDAGQNYER